jgi:hypothetical protein
MLMLVPQSETLFEYYRRQGFREALFRGRRVIAGAGETPQGILLDDSPEPGELNGCFEAALSGKSHVARTDAHWARSLSYLLALGARREGRLVGYAVYGPDGAPEPYGMARAITPGLELEPCYAGLMMD